VTGFGGGYRDKCRAGRRLLGSRSAEAALDGDIDEEGRRQQHEGDMAIPAQVAADLRVIESEGFAGLQVLVG
jgi:hypothetical protein